MHIKSRSFATGAVAIVLSVCCGAALADSPWRGLVKGFAGQPDLPRAAESAPRADARWYQMHNLLVEKIKNHANTKLIILGDSIVQNMDTAQDLLTRTWPDADPINLGIGGDTTQNLLWRIQNGEVTGLHPRVAIIMIGTNNLRNTSDRDIVSGIKAVSAELQKRLPQTRFLILGLLPREKHGNNPVRERIKNINVALARSVDGKKTFFLDVGDLLVDARHRDISPMIMPDYLHPSFAGYQLIFAGMKPAVDKLL